MRGGRKYGVPQKRSNGAIAQKVIKRLREELNLHIPDGTILERVYTGYWQKAQGGWSWCLYHPEYVTMGDIGSNETATDIARAKTLSYVYLTHGCEICIEGTAEQRKKKIIARPKRKSKWKPKLIFENPYILGTLQPKGSHD